MAHERARRPGRFKRRKPMRRLAKRARYQRSARAQGRQIAKIARTVSHLKDTVREETSMAALYQMQFSSPVKTVDTQNYSIIVPLTCGVSQKGTTPFEPVTNLNLPTAYGGTLGWEPAWQPRDMHPGTAQGSHAGVPPWIKLYNQSVSIRFWAHTTPGPTDITVSVLRLRRDGPVGNLKSIATRLDGPTLAGPAPTAADAASYITKGRDFLASDGATFPQAVADPAGGPPVPQPASVNANGSTNVKWNPELYTVEYVKSFTLGAAKNPFVAAPAVEPPVALPTAAISPDHNQNHEDVNFTIRYGGAKLSAVPPPDQNELALDSMAVTDMYYKNINIEHKRWLVIQSSNPEIGASVYAPFMQFNSRISTRVPV